MRNSRTPANLPEPSRTSQNPREPPRTPENPLVVGLNPYGLSYSVGLQGNNPSLIGLQGFIRLVREFGLRVIELDHRGITPLSSGALAKLRGELEGLTTICSYWLAHQPGETLEQAVRCNTALGS